MWKNKYNLRKAETGFEIQLKRKQFCVESGICEESLKELEEKDGGVILFERSEERKKVLRIRKQFLNELGMTEDQLRKLETENSDNVELRNEKSNSPKQPTTSKMVSVLASTSNVELAQPVSPNLVDEVQPSNMKQASSEKRPNSNIASKSILKKRIRYDCGNIHHENNLSAIATARTNTSSATTTAVTVLAKSSSVTTRSSTAKLLPSTSSASTSSAANPSPSTSSTAKPLPSTSSAATTANPSTNSNQKNFKIVPVECPHLKKTVKLLLPFERKQ